MLPRTVPRGLAASRALAAAVGVTALATAAAGCGHSAHAIAKPSASASRPSAVQSDLQARAAAGTALAWTGTFAVKVASAPGTKIRVYIQGNSAYHVDVVEGAITATLYGSPAGAVACPEQLGRPTICYRVAAAGQAIPARFDAGIERVFTTDLPTLAVRAADFGVVAEPALVATTSAPAAHCFQLTGDNDNAPLTASISALVDVGEYCLSDTGLPVRLTFPSGTLTLASHGPAPTAAQLTPPTTPRTLPSSIATSTAKGSPAT